MAKKINAFLASIGLPHTAIAIGPYAVVTMGCDRWTFSREHLFFRIKEALSRYAPERSIPRPAGKTGMPPNDLARRPSRSGGLFCFSGCATLPP